MEHKCYIRTTPKYSKCDSLLTILKANARKTNNNGGYHDINTSNAPGDPAVKPSIGYKKGFVHGSEISYVVRSYGTLQDGRRSRFYQSPERCRYRVQRRGTVCLFKLKDRIGRLENCVFSLHKIIYTESMYPKNSLFEFEKKSLTLNTCVHENVHENPCPLAKSMFNTCTHYFSYFFCYQSVRAECSGICPGS